MTVNVMYEPQSVNTDEYIHYAQIIVNAFTKALQDNECSVKLIIGLRQEISNKKDEVELIKELNNNPRASAELNPSYYTDTNTTTNPGAPNEHGVDQFVLNTLTKSLMDSCFPCKLKFPKLSVNSNLNFAFDGLKVSLDVFNSVFKNLKNPNVCHVSGVFAFSCVPSILSLLMLFVSAYSSVLALQKINNISLQAFIKGIISGLIGKLTASLNIRLDTSNTGVVCLIDAIREIANQLVEQQQELSHLSAPEILAALGLDSDDIDVTNILGYQPPTINEPQLVLEQEPNQNCIISSYKNSYIEKYIHQIVEENETITNNVSSVFKEISNIVDDVVEHLNENIEQLFGLIDFFQCEAERSGGNFSEIVAYADRLVSLINLMSSILGVVLRRIYAPLCKLANSVQELSTAVNPDTIELGNPLTELEQAEVISEYLGKVVELTEDSNGNITPLIYNKDVPTLLPKLSLTNCNLKEFIQAHSIDNIIKKIFEESRQDQTFTRDSFPRTPGQPYIRKGVILPKENVVDKNKWSVYPIKYQVPSIAKTTTKDPEALIEIQKNFTDTYGAASSIKSILELVYDNPIFRQPTPTASPSKTTPVDIAKPSSSYTDKKFRENLSSPTPLSESEQKTFNNKCRDINDVLNILEGILK